MSKVRLPVFKLKFSEALHISDVRLDYGVSEKQYHSDAMAAALLAIGAKWGEDIPEHGRIPCTISSLFPYLEHTGTSTHYFLPKPMVRLRISDQENIAKAIKKLQWVDQYYFERIVGGDTLGKIGAQISGAYLSREAIDTNLMTVQTLPRVQVPRNETQVTQIFYMQMIRFIEGAGLYFFAHGNDNELEWLRRALYQLGIEGIGTDRNVGNGHFTFSEDVLEIEVPDQAEASTNLSLFCPESFDQLRDLVHPHGNTDLIKRGGWITSDEGLGIRKKPIYFFREGSVFKHPEPQQTGISVLGRPVIDLTPDTLPYGRQLDHKVYRHGQSIFLPLKLAL